MLYVDTATIVMPFLQIASCRAVVFIILFVFSAVITRADDRQTSRAGEVTIAIIGDSLADGLWGGFYRTAHHDGRLKFLRRTRNSSGFATSNMIDLAQASFAGGPPDAVVVMVGANDNRTLFEGDDAALLFGSTKWIDRYRSRVRAFAGYLKAKKLPVIWVQLPIMATADASSAAELINRVVKEAAHDAPNIFLFPTWSLAADGGGRFTQTFRDLGGATRVMRQNDGIHFTNPACDLIATKVLDRLREVLPALADIDLRDESRVGAPHARQ